MKKGKLTVIAGPMFAGKTTALITKANQLTPGSYIVVKPTIDTRYNKTDVVAHSGLTIGAYVLDGNAPDLSVLDISSFSTLFIDELNFFAYAPLKLAIDEVLSRGIDVVGCGLLYDFLKKPFGATQPLSKEADEFIQLFAVCDRCKGNANHSYRKIAGYGQVLVGAGESYGACCQVCWDVFQSGEFVSESVDNRQVNTIIAT